MLTDTLVCTHSFSSAGIRHGRLGRVWPLRELCAREFRRSASETPWEDNEIRNGLLGETHRTGMASINENSMLARNSTSLATYLERIAHKKVPNSRDLYSHYLILARL